GFCCNLPTCSLGIFATAMPPPFCERGICEPGRGEQVNKPNPARLFSNSLRSGSLIKKGVDRSVHALVENSCLETSTVAGTGAVPAAGTFFPWLGYVPRQGASIQFRAV